MSQITTHILDTSKGQPAKGVKVYLEKQTGENKWLEIANGLTNDDGRLLDLLAKGAFLEHGIYRLVFATGAYFKNCGIIGFYPSVTISFHVSDNTHYHIPLLLNPFGYSTYRGS